MRNGSFCVMYLDIQYFQKIFLNTLNPDGPTQLKLGAHAISIYESNKINFLFFQTIKIHGMALMRQRALTTLCELHGLDHYAT